MLHYMLHLMLHFNYYILLYILTCYNMLHLLLKRIYWLF